MLTGSVRAGLLALFVGGLVAVVGCGDKPVAKDEKKEKDKDKSGHDKSRWWCDEHGVPEEECTMCSDKAYKVAKDKDEICPKHSDRSKSQCFICNPELWEKSAARYKAKEGKDAPWPDENAPGGKKKP